MQVSELTHRLGTAEGNLRSLEDESARLRLQNQQLGRDRAEIDTEAADSRAKLQALAKDGFDERIYVRGAKTVNYGRIAQVMSIVTTAGYKKVALVTDQDQDSK